MRKIITSVDLIRAAATWPISRRISRTASEVMTDVIFWPPIVRPLALISSTASSSWSGRELHSPLRKGCFPGCHIKVFVEFALRNPVVPTLGLNSLKLSGVNPALQCGIADSQHFGGVTRL